MDLERTLPTRGQLERELSQTVQSLYRSEFGHLPSKVVCHLFADRVAIIAENTTTTIEQLLLDNSRLDLAHEIRVAIGETFASQVRQTVTDILQVEAIDAICDSTLDSGYLGMIIFLKDAPSVRLAKKERRQSKGVAFSHNGHSHSKESHVEILSKIHCDRSS